MGNFNESYILKREHGPRNVRLEDMPWPVPSTSCDFADEMRTTTEEWLAQLERLALKLIPVYSAALGQDMTAAFESPLFRVRLSHYPPVEEDSVTPFGINPHVDTSFFTILATTGPGLVVQDNATGRWVQVPVVENAFIVNTGQLLRNITNDTWNATKHYVLPGQEHRYSLPFFFNATADFKLTVCPKFCSDDNPAKYPPTSYLDGQGVVQGE
eukprot:TRINITY_DN38724_c0_g1_i1.p1 TRINITY_DN38724_c0_g1~~TRINITY_DN38724_c0_g1_i1.p1  ORF type:complete len:213 (+),score=27.63 TRINITY_DN38724_c0_g1_i1:243-881(+)